MFYHLRQRVHIKKGQKIGLCLSKSISPCTLLFFLNTHNFEVWTLDPQYLKKIISNDKHSFLRKKIDLKYRHWIPNIYKKKYFYWQTQVLSRKKGPEKSSFKNARKQSKMRRGAGGEGNSSLLILKLPTGKVSFFRIWEQFIWNFK